MKIKLLNIAFTIVFCSLLSACVSSGYKFSERNISQLQIGTTTPTQAELILEGKPYQTITNAKGTFLAWIYSSATPFGGKNKMIQLHFVDDKLVRVVQVNGISLSNADRLRLMPQ